MEDKNFIRGFNNGYLLRDHEPELLNKLLNGLTGKTPYIEGLKEGSIQRENEKRREHMKNSIDQRQDNKEKDRGDNRKHSR